MALFPDFQFICQFSSFHFLSGFRLLTEKVSGSLASNKLVAKAISMSQHQKQIERERPIPPPHPPSSPSALPPPPPTSSSCLIHPLIIHLLLQPRITPSPPPPPPPRPPPRTHKTVVILSLDLCTFWLGWMVVGILQLGVAGGEGEERKEGKRGGGGGNGLDCTGSEYL